MRPEGGADGLRCGCGCGCGCGRGRFAVHTSRAEYSGNSVANPNRRSCTHTSCPRSRAVCTTSMIARLHMNHVKCTSVGSQAWTRCTVAGGPTRVPTTQLQTRPPGSVAQTARAPPRFACRRYLTARRHAARRLRLRARGAPRPRAPAPVREAMPRPAASRARFDANVARRPHARLEAAGGDEDLVEGRVVERQVLAPPADGLCTPSGSIVEASIIGRAPGNPTGRGRGPGGPHQSRSTGRPLGTCSHCRSIWICHDNPTSMQAQTMMLIGAASTRALGRHHMGNQHAKPPAHQRHAWRPPMLAVVHLCAATKPLNT